MSEQATCCESARWSIRPKLDRNGGAPRWSMRESDQGQWLVDFCPWCSARLPVLGLPDCATCENTGRIFAIAQSKSGTHRDRIHCPDCHRRGA